MEISRYPDLSLVKEEPPSPCLSPVLPMLPAPDGKGRHNSNIINTIKTFIPVTPIIINLMFLCMQFKHTTPACFTVWKIFMNVLLFHSLGSEIKLRDIKTEPSAMFFGSPFGPMSNDSKQGLVSVAITLRPAAAEVGILVFMLNFCENTVNLSLSVGTKSKTGKKRQAFVSKCVVQHNIRKIPNI